MLPIIAPMTESLLPRRLDKKTKNRSYPESRHLKVKNEKARKREVTVPAAETTGSFVSLVQSPWFTAVVIAAVTFTVFIRTLGADFVMWDDDPFIYENPTIGGLTLENLRLIFTNVTVSSTWYTPLTGLRWCITYQFFQLNPLGYHLGNLLLHTADAALIFYVLRKLLVLGLSGPGSAKPWQINVCASIGAMLWSLHPMRVETVSWAANAYGQMLFFLLISLLCYLWAYEAKTTGRRRWLLTASLILFVASLLTQPAGIGSLAVFVVLDVYPLGRLGGDSGWWKSADARKALLEKIPFICAAVVVVLINIIVLVSAPVGGHRLVSLAEFGLFERFMQAMYIWAYYIWRPWYPVNLIPCYPILVNFNPLSLPFVASAIGVIGMVVLLILLRRRWPLALTLAICYLILLVPVLGVMEHPHYPCDRYSLTVSICFSVLIAAFLGNPKTKKPVRYAAFFLSIVVTAILGTLSWRQTLVWNNTVSLFEHIIHTLGDDPYTDDIHARFGIFYAKQGRYPKAIEHFQKTLEINPKLIPIYIELAKLHVVQREADKAAACLEKALSVAPNSSGIHYFLGRVYLLILEPAKTKLHWEKAMEIDPGSTRTMSELAELLATYHDAQFRNPAQAIHLAKRSCELTEYKNPALLNILATAMASSNNFAEAVALAEKALQIARSTGDKELTERILYRLNLFKTNQPYIEQ